MLSECFNVILFRNSLRKVWKFNYVIKSCLFFHYKNFNLLLGQLSLRNVWKFKGVRFSRLHVLSTNWGLLIVIGWIPTKHAFGMFQCDIISKFVEESLEIQICQKMLPLFPFTKFPIYFWVNFRWGMFEIQRCQIFSPACSIYYLGATDCNRVNSHEACFRKVSMWFYFELSRGKFGKSNMSEDLAPFSIHTNFNLLLNQVSLRKVLNFRIFCLLFQSTKVICNFPISAEITC